jgi:hypothetical protein
MVLPSLILKVPARAKEDAPKQIKMRAKQIILFIRLFLSERG